MPTPPHHEKKKHDQEARQRRTELIQAIRATFTSPTGKVALRWLSQSAGHGKPSFLPAAPGQPLDPLAAAFRDGRKSLIDEILEALAIPEDQLEPEPKAKV